MQQFLSSIHLFPTYLWVGSALFILSVGYILFLMSESRRLQQRRILDCFITILLASCILHAVILCQLYSGSEKSWFSILTLSLISSFELFLGNTRIFDNGFQDFLFAPGHTSWLIAMSATYLLALSTSIYLIVNLLFKRISSKIWLFFHTPSKKNYIFWGKNQNTSILVNDILKKIPEKKKIIILDTPSSEDINYDTSVFKRLHVLLHEKKLGLSRRERRQVSILKTRLPTIKIDGKSLFRTMGLSGLLHWFNQEGTEIFVLSENETDNLDVLDILLSADIQCKAIYCRSNTQGGGREVIENYYRRTKKCNVKLVDSAYLSFQSILKDKQYYHLHPVHFVDIAEHNGKSLGFVQSSFNSMIIGFGEAGQCAAGYLYEFAAFVGKDRNRSPFTCHVFDPNVNLLSPNYSIHHPGIEIDRFRFHSLSAGTTEFWASYSRIVSSLNYVIICTGNDKQNLQIALDILCMLPAGHKAAVLVQQNHPSPSQERQARQLESRYPYFATFGETKRLWTYDNISNESMDVAARAFYEQYSYCAGEIPTWKIRQKKIKEGEFKAIRQQSQDYENVLHQHTKEILLGENTSLYHALEEGIFSGREYLNFEGKHFDKTKGAELEQLGEYMAIGEHLRWLASHAVMGYREGPKTDDTTRTHEAMIPFACLSPRTQHYDWLVVKTTVMLALNNKALEQNQTVKLDVSPYKNYMPSPLQLDDVKVPESLLKLSEQISKNVHEVWALKRYSEGWRFGEERNDKLKLHPDMRPYDDLSDSEKEYDRNTTLNTIKMILKLGYTIKK